MTKRPRRGTSGMLHGRPGSGKSTLLHTMPGPRLIGDAEMGDDEFEGDIHVLPWEEWDANDQDPRMLTPKTSVIIDIGDYHDYRMAVDTIMWDRSRLFRSFGLDSLTKIQEFMEEELLPLNRNKLKARRRDYDHFGVLLDYMKADLDGLHALTKTRGLITWWVCQTDRESDPMRPQLAGALRKKIANIPDIVGFLRVEEGIDESGTQAIWRVMGISSAEGTMAEEKCRRRRVTAKWGEEIPEPNLARIAAVASPRKKKTTTKEEAN